MIKGSRQAPDLSSAGRVVLPAVQEETARVVAKMPVKEERAEPQGGDPGSFLPLSGGFPPPWARIVRPEPPPNRALPAFLASLLGHGALILTLVASAWLETEAGDSGLEAMVVELVVAGSDAADRGAEGGASPEVASALENAGEGAPAPAQPGQDTPPARVTEIPPLAVLPPEPVLALASAEALPPPPPAPVMAPEPEPVIPEPAPVPIPETPADAPAASPAPPAEEPIMESAPEPPPPPPPPLSPPPPAASVSPPSSPLAQGRSMPPSRRSPVLAATPGSAAPASRPVKATQGAGSGMDGGGAPAAPASAPAGDPAASAAVTAYLVQVQRRLQAALMYPAEGRRLRLTASVAVRFVIRADGSLAPTGTAVLRNDGAAMFAEAALETLRRAAPFAPPPVAGLSLDVPIAFLLRGGP